MSKFRKYQPSHMQLFYNLLKYNKSFIVVRNLIGERFGATFMTHQFPITVLYELAAPSVPDELVEDIMSSDKPMKVKE
ncbi:hypothetical protein N9E53_06365 [Amylibacter sp.]|nr:hypothetical protein [Amylibacter sp.]